MFEKLKYVLLFCATFIIIPFYAQKTQKPIKKGYQVAVKMRQTPKDTVFYLVGYVGDKRVKIDSAVTQKTSRNQFVFKADTALASGVYVVVNQRRMQLFEFVVDKNQQLSVEFDTLNTINTIVVKNSPETSLFYGYIRGLSAKQDTIKEMESVLDYAQQTGNTQLFNTKYSEYMVLIKKSQEYTKSFFEKHPKELIAKALRMNSDIEMPPLPKLPDGSGDSTWGWHYYKAHYWDNVDLTDARMIRTPIFGKKAITFFDDVIHQHPDSIMVEIDTFMNKTRPSKEMFKYMLNWLTLRYQESSVVGHDAVFVHLVERYYMNNEANWMSENMLRILTKRAAQLKSLLIGAKIPELVMQDTSGTSLSSYKTGTKYTIIWFWDPDCSHCVIETPKLLDFYKQFKDSLDVEVFAVSLNSDLNLWKKYIRENNLTWINVGGEKANIDYAMVFDLVATPVAYIIDEQKRIIAKNIPVESIKSIILRYEEITKKR